MTRRHGAGGTYESVVVLHLVGFGLHYAASHGAFRDGRRFNGDGGAFSVYTGTLSTLSMLSMLSIYPVYFVSSLFCLLCLRLFSLVSLLLSPLPLPK